MEPFVVVIYVALDYVAEPPWLAAENQDRLPERVHLAVPKLHGLAAGNQVRNGPAILHVLGHIGEQLREVTLPAHHGEDSSGLECLCG